MATKVHMEALSPTMEEGRLVKWTKHEGDAVKSGETLAEVETDKAVMELVARADGQLLKVVVPEGSTVPVGNVVAWIGKPGEKVDGAGGTEQAAAAPKPAPATASPKPASAPAPIPVAAPADATRVKASPLAKRIAKEVGVDLKLVQGSGPGGRVVKRDVEGGAAQAPAVATPAPRSVLRAPSCPEHGARPEPDAQFCSECGRRLGHAPGYCVRCGTSLEVDARYCNRCGARVAA